MTMPRTGFADHSGPDGLPHDPESDETGSGSVPAEEAERQADIEASPAAPSRAKMAFNTLDFLAITIFVVVAYIVTVKLWKSPTSLTPWANSTDQTFFEWMLTHAVRIFTHGENPFFTTQLNAPSGVNLMSNTSMLGLAVPFAPLTAWIGPAPVFVLITMLGLAGTATAWYWVLSRHFVHNRLGAFIGGVACGFGPGIITHANGHPNLTAQFVIPFILWRALALRDSKRPVRDGVILGLLVTYQAFLNEELLFLTAFGGTMFALIYAAFRPKIVRAAVAPVLTGLGTAGILSFVLLAYPLWFQFKGPQHFSGLPDFLRAYPYRLPLNSFVKQPTLSIWGQPNAYDSGTEQNSFLGWYVLIAVAVIIVLLWRRHPSVRALAVVGVFFAWASLGDQVVVTNPSKTHPYSLWDHLSHLPLFDSVLPSRLAMVTLPVVGVLLAMGVTAACRLFEHGLAQERLMKMAGGVAAVVLVVVACITVAPTPVTVAPRPTVPTFFSSGQWRAWVPAGDSVLSATPYDSTSFMRWAVAAKLDFSVPGGYFLGPAPLEAGQSTPTGQFGPQWRNTMLVMGSIGNNTWSLPDDPAPFKAQAADDLKYWKTAIIVLTADQPYAEQSKAAINTLLGFSGRQVGDVWLWDVRSISGS